MKLPDSVKAIRSRYVAAFPIPTGAPGEQHEENVRQWSIRFAEQVAFEQGPQWGMKRADPNRPISKDTIALNDGRLLIWDLLLGTGTGNPRLLDDPDSEELVGQVFVVVQPKNHLGTPQQPPPVPPTPPPAPCPPVDLSAVINGLAEIRSEQAAQRALIEALKLTVQFPVYRGSLFGYGITLRPENS